jgi:hypothetical protein
LLEDVDLEKFGKKSGTTAVLIVENRAVDERVRWDVIAHLKP